MQIKLLAKIINFGHLHKHLYQCGTCLCSLGQLQWMHLSLVLPDPLSICMCFRVHPQSQKSRNNIVYLKISVTNLDGSVAGYDDNIHNIQSQQYTTNHTTKHVLLTSVCVIN